MPLLLRFKRKPEECQEAFNTRFPKRIYDRNVKFKCRLLLHRVLILAFQSSKRKRGFYVGYATASPDIEMRTRNRLWWDGVKDESGRTQTQHDMKRAAKEPLTEWDDALVLVFGSLEEYPR